MDGEREARGGPGIRVVCWDWNGTLLDDARIGLACMNEVLAGSGLEPIAGLDDYRRRYRFPILEFYRDCGFAVGVPGVFEDAARRYLGAFARRIPSAALHPGARSVLASCRGAGLAQVLISATVEPALLTQVAQRGIGAAFDHVGGITDPFAASKHHVVAAWLARSGVRPDEVIMVGDTNHDAEIAEELGTHFVQFLGGHQADRGARWSIERLGDLPRVIERIDAAVRA